MSLNSRLIPWKGVAYRHIPAHVTDVRDFRWAGVASDNRWNVSGEPTVYLACDVGVAIAEWARHFDVDRTPGLAKQTVERTVYRLSMVVDHVLDVRDDDLCTSLSLTNAPYCFLDKGIARAVAGLLRCTSDVQALLLPSVAMLDKPERWCMALFLEKLAPDPTIFIPFADIEGPFRWR